MSLSLEFYAGDADKIGAAFSESEFECLRDGSLARVYADLSLHISSTDLDILSEQAAGLLKRPPIRLLDLLLRNVGGVPDESSADVVASEWVELMAAVPESEASTLSGVWLSAVMAESGEEIDTRNPDAAKAIDDLLALCRWAKANNASVVFGWYL